MNQDHRHLEKSIQLAFDGELEEEERVTLRETLRHAPEALGLWCDYAQLDSELRRYAHGRIRVPGTTPAATACALDRQRRRQVSTSLFAAAAVITLTAIVLSFIWVSNDQSARTTISFSTESILRSTGIPLSDPTALTAALDAGESLELVQGVARLTLESGVEAVIEAPATFRLASPEVLELPGGRGWFHVPPGACGFTVALPGAKVVDLGTEFGIDCQTSKDMEVHVITGRVRAQSLRGQAGSATVEAGHAIRLGPLGQWLATAAEPDRFLRKLPDARLQLCFPFDRLENGLTPVDTNLPIARADARIMTLPGETPTARLVPGVHGSAIAFDGSPTWLEHPWKGISSDAPRTIAVWIRMPESRRTKAAPPLVMWGDPRLRRNAKFKLAVVSPRQKPDSTVARVSFGEWFADGATELADGRWHHLAVVYRGNLAPGIPDVVAYVDGQAEELSPVRESPSPIPTPISTETLGPHSMPLSIGRYELPPNPSDHFLRAAIDDLHIIAGALDAEEIRALAEAPKNSR